MEKNTVAAPFVCNNSRGERAAQLQNDASRRRNGVSKGRHMLLTISKPRWCLGQAALGTSP